MTNVSERRGQSVSIQPVSAGPARRGIIATLGGVVAAIAVAVALDSAVAAIAHAAGVSHLFSPLQFANYTTLTVIGIAAGAAGWAVVRALAADPRRRLRVLAPGIVAFSFVPDLIVGVSRRMTGTSWGGVAALMVMHILVAVVAIVAFARVLPIPSNKERLS